MSSLPSRRGSPSSSAKKSSHNPRSSTRVILYVASLVVVSVSIGSILFASQNFESLPASESASYFFMSTNMVQDMNQSNDDEDLLLQNNAKDSFQLAPQQSYGVLRDISDAAWVRLQRRAVRAPQYRHPEFPERAFGVPERWMIKNLQPVLTCPLAERVGSVGEADGAFWMCEVDRLFSTQEEQQQLPVSTNDSVPHNSSTTASTCLIYSIGYSGPWEIEMVQRLPTTCELHIVDPLGTPPNEIQPFLAQQPNIHWHAWSLTSGYAETGTVVDHDGNATTTSPITSLTLSNMRQRLGHVGRHLDVLKLDCGAVCTWSTWRDWVALNATQILWQVTGLPSPREGNKFHPSGPLAFSKVIGALQNDGGYAMFAKEYRRNGPRLALGYLRLHPDFWTQAKQMGGKEMTEGG